jgi:hypothetical protein
MKAKVIGSLVLALGLGLADCKAQEAGQVEKLNQQLQEMRESFERQQREMQASFERKLREQQQEIDALKRQLAPPATNRPLAGAAARTELGISAENPPPGPQVLTKGWSPADPIRIGSGTAYVDIGASITVAAGSASTNGIYQNLELGDHDPNQRGFTLQGVEFSMQGAVDPYFRGNLNLSYGLTPAGESSLELEEGWLETVALPANLQLRVGQIITLFGRQNTQHLHAWSYVDTPLVNGRYLGPDGLRNPGAWVSWLMPVPFYSQFIFGIQNSQGETAASFRGGEGALDAEEVPGVPFSYRPSDNDRGVQHFDDMLLSGRYEASLDLTDTQVLLMGLSGAFGPNSRGGSEGGNTRTSIAGMDVTWKWTSPNQHGGFPFVAWQTEGMIRWYDAGYFDWDLNGDGEASPYEMVNPATGKPAVLPFENLTDYGLYSQVQYGFRKGWVAGLRFDWVSGDTAYYETLGLVYDGAQYYTDPARAPRWRLSPNMTWYPTEFSKLRLQFNYDQRTAWPDAYSVWLQMEISLGAHAAHKF